MLLVEAEGEISKDRLAEMSKILDEKLNESNEKYFKYRRWGMLAEPEVVLLKDGTYADYREYLKKQGRVLNQIKPVTVINTDERKDFFLAHIDK